MRHVSQIGRKLIPFVRQLLTHTLVQICVCIGACLCACFLVWVRRRCPRNALYRVSNFQKFTRRRRVHHLRNGFGDYISHARNWRVSTHHIRCMQCIRKLTQTRSKRTHEYALAKIWERPTRPTIYSLVSVNEPRRRMRRLRRRQRHAVGVVWV